MKDRISARLNHDTAKRLHTLMEVYGTNISDTLEAAILSMDVDKKPKTEQVYHAEVSESGDMVKCPVGKNKGLWVRESVCRTCEDSRCDIKR